ncbi:metallophosphoesterase [Candidatus Nitrospira bockiana]
MIRHLRPRLLKTRFRVAHRSSLLVHHLFTRFPRLELGHSEVEVTRIECRHRPLAGRRAVQITDLHLDRYQPRHDVLLAAIANLAPDWVFVTGDLLTVASGVPHLFRFLTALRRIAPVYLTLGNHDHYSGVSLHRYRDLAKRHDLHLLVNDRIHVPCGSGELAIVGLDDPSLHRADLACLPPARAGRFTLLLAHAPSVLDLLDHSHVVDLILCGHSHGGQWRLPSRRSVYLPYGCKGRASGYYYQNGHCLYVNRGIGWSVLPMRWNCPPEIVLVEWR